MNKKRTLSVSILAALIVASVCVASIPLGINAAQADKESVLSTYVSDDKNWGFIAPDGVDVSGLVWNYKEELREDAEIGKLLATKKTQAERITLRNKIRGDRDLIASNMSSILYPGVDSYEELDWFAASYIMRNKEYDIDVPYDTDGTNEPLKYCLKIVEGMEDEAYEFLGSNIEKYKDILVIRTSKYGSYSEGIAIMDAVAERVLDAGIVIHGCSYNMKEEAICLSLDDEEFNEETYAFLKMLANETGRVIKLQRVTHVVM